jgi:hypothetical protein
MPDLIIAGTPIAFPNDSASPDWAPAVIQFAEVVASALSEVVGNFDIVPQRFIIDSIPNSTDVPVTNLSFSTANVIGADIYYAVYRNTSISTVSEQGHINIVYNTTNSIGQKWSFARESTGDAQVTLDISDTGQVNINLTALSGTGHNGYISYYAKALQTTY